MAETQQATVLPTTPDSRYLDNIDEMLGCLKHVRDQRISLDLRIDNIATRYTCKLLDVGVDEFLIDDIHPRDGNIALRQAKSFSLSARGSGIYLYIESAKLKKWDEERGIPYFHVALPHKILFQQRRRSARFAIPLRVSANGASICLQNEAEAVGRILDISAGGCRAEFSLPLAWQVKADKSLASCSITIPKLLEITSEGVVRHFHENKHNKTLVCGIELTKMNITDRRRLERFIQMISKQAS